MRMRGSVLLACAPTLFLGMSQVPVCHHEFLLPLAPAHCWTRRSEQYFDICRALESL